MRPDSVTHAWGKALKRAGLPSIRCHEIRHTHATLMLKAGVHPRVVMERLGHADIRTTSQTHSHVLPGLQEQAALAFEKGITGVTAEQAEAVG